MHPIEELLTSMDKLTQLFDFINKMDQSMQQPFMHRLTTHILDYIAELALEGNYEQASKIQGLITGLNEDARENYRSSQEAQRTKTKSRRTKSKST